jgi:hypothetical protein
MSASKVLQQIYIKGDIEKKKQQKTNYFTSEIPPPWSRG